MLSLPPLLPLYLSLPLLLPLPLSLPLSLPQVYLVNSYRHKSSGKEEGTDAHLEEKKAKEDEEETEKKGGISRDPKEGVKGPAAEMFDVSKLQALCRRALLCVVARIECMGRCREGFCELQQWLTRSFRDSWKVQLCYNMTKRSPDLCPAYRSWSYAISGPTLYQDCKASVALQALW